MTLLNVHKRSIEATSVTPFAPRAVDRGLATVTVALARHGEPVLTAPTRAGDLPSTARSSARLRQAVRERAEVHRKDISKTERDELGAKIAARVDDLLDAWEGIAAD